MLRLGGRPTCAGECVMAPGVHRCDPRTRWPRGEAPAGLGAHPRRVLCTENQDPIYSFGFPTFPIRSQFACSGLSTSQRQSCNDSLFGADSDRHLAVSCQGRHRLRAAHQQGHHISRIAASAGSAHQHISWISASERSMYQQDQRTSSIVTLEA